MKWLVFLMLAISWAANVDAQWVVPQRTAPQQNDFDRPRPAHHRAGIRPLSSPQPTIPNWPFPNVDVTNDPNNDQTEPSIAINPSDSNNIIIGANDDRTFNALWAYSSTDGGNTWQNQPLPPVAIESSDVFATDPSVSFNTSGIAYFGNGHLTNGNANDVACFRSTNLGTNWSVTGYPFLNTNGNDTSSDKYFITVDADANSLFHNRIYATWVELTNSILPQIAFSFSTDGGVSWSPRIHLTDRDYYTSPVPATAPDGALLITFEKYRLDTTEILVVHSTDGGITFSQPTVIAHYNDVGPWRGDSATNDGYPVLKDTVRANSFPSIAIDRSALHPGRAYVSWCGKDATGRSHVFLATSDDDGQSWSTPSAVDEDSSNIPTDKFFSWVAIDPINGDVGIDFYDSRLDPNNILCDLFMAFSTDGGTSFTTRRISNASTDPRIGRDYWTVETPHGPDTFQFFGDYIGVAGYSNTWYPAWTDGRGGTDLEIYTAIVQPFAPMPVTQLASHDTTVNGKPATVLTWQYTPETTFGYSLYPAGYEFNVAKDGSQVSPQPGAILQFVDTNSQQGHEYKVTVVSNGYRSITDSISNAKNAVAVEMPDISSIRFSNEPAIAGREDELFLDCDEACHISITFYDELGREIGAPISDGIVSLHHEIGFTPEEPGVQFFVMKEISSISSKEITGKISVLR